MTQPAPRFSIHAQQLMGVIKRQTWLLFIIILLSMGYEFLLGQHHFVISKNILAGGLLAWVSHYIFAKFSLRSHGAKFRRQVVNNFYFAQALKWVVTMAGFALIFILLIPLKPLWVFIGYFLIQLGQMALLYIYNKNQLNNQ